MEELFSNNIYIILFCFLLGMEGNFEGEENKKIVVFYLFIGALSVTRVVRTLVVLTLLCIGIFILCEILTADTHKSILLHTVHSKIIDALFKSVFCYNVFLIAIAVVINSDVFLMWIKSVLDYFGLSTELSPTILKILALLIFLFGINKTLSDDFNFTDCKKFLSIFQEKFLLTSFNLTPELDERLKIIAKIEDQHYWKRKSYISLSFSHYKLTNAKRRESQKISFIKWIQNIFYNVISRKRGYSTIQMQLTRTLALDTGYKYTLRRKFYELFYAVLYFRNLKKCINYNLKDDTLYKKYLLNIYAHNARCFYTKYSYENNMMLFFGMHENTNLENLSLEQVFVATHSLSNKLSLISEDTVDSLLKYYNLTNLNREKILEVCEQVKNTKN